MSISILSTVYTTYLPTIDINSEDINQPYTNEKVKH